MTGARGFAAMCACMCLLVTIVVAKPKAEKARELGEVAKRESESEFECDSGPGSVLARAFTSVLDQMRESLEQKIAAVESKLVTCETGTFDAGGSEPGSGEDGFVKSHTIQFQPGFKSAPQFAASINSFERRQIWKVGKNVYRDTNWAIRLEAGAISASEARVKVTGWSTFLSSVKVAWVACAPPL